MSRLAELEQSVPDYLAWLHKVKIRGGKVPGLKSFYPYGEKERSAMAFLERAGLVRQLPPSRHRLSPLTQSGASGGGYITTPAGEATLIMGKPREHNVVLSSARLTELGERLLLDIASGKRWLDDTDKIRAATILEKRGYLTGVFFPDGRYRADLTSRGEALVRSTAPATLHQHSLDSPAGRATAEAHARLAQAQRGLHELGLEKETLRGLGYGKGQLTPSWRELSAEGLRAAKGGSPAVMRATLREIGKEYREMKRYDPTHNPHTQLHSAERTVLANMPDKDVLLRPTTGKDTTNLKSLLQKGLISASQSVRYAFLLTTKGRRTWDHMEQERLGKQRLWWQKATKAEPAQERKLARRYGMVANPLDIRFLRYIGETRKWWDWAVDKRRSIRTGAVVTAKVEDLAKKSVPVATRGKGFLLDIRRRELEILPHAVPPAGSKETAGQLWVKEPAERKGFQFLKRTGGFGGLVSPLFRRDNPQTMADLRREIHTLSQKPSPTAQEANRLEILLDILYQSTSGRHLPASAYYANPTIKIILPNKKQIRAKMQPMMMVETLKEKALADALAGKPISYKSVDWTRVAELASLRGSKGRVLRPLFAARPVAENPTWNPHRKLVGEFAHERMLDWPSFKRRHPEATVRTVSTDGHRARIAYYGPRRAGRSRDYKLVSVLHPPRENPCSLGM